MSTLAWEIFEVISVCLWSSLLSLLGYNMYNYLLKKKGYKFIPMLLAYSSMTLLSILVICYYIERINKESFINTNESAWFFYVANIRLTCLVAILGYTGLVIELSLKLQMMQTSAQVNFSQRRRLTFPKGLQEESEVSTHSSIILDTGLNASKVGSIDLSTPSFAFRLSPNNSQESRLMALNTKQTRILEWVIFCVAVSLVIFYNGMALLIGCFIKEEGITDNQTFYSSVKTIKAYESFMVINCLLQVIITLVLMVSACKLKSLVKNFFQQSFKTETRSLMCVTITITITSFLTLLIDAITTVFQLTQTIIEATAYDGLLVSTYVLWIPCFVMNILYFRNMRSIKKMQTQEKEEKQDHSQNMLGNKETATKLQLETIYDDEERAMTFASSHKDPSSKAQSQSYQSTFQKGHTSEQIRQTMTGSGENPSFNSSYQPYGAVSGRRTSLSTVSRGLLIADHVLKQRQVANMFICQVKRETPQISEDNLSDSQKMSLLSQPIFDNSVIVDEEFNSPTNKHRLNSQKGGSNFALYQLDNGDLNKHRNTGAKPRIQGSKQPISCQTSLKTRQVGSSIHSNNPTAQVGSSGRSFLPQGSILESRKDFLSAKE